MQKRYMLAALLLILLGLAAFRWPAPARRAAGCSHTLALHQAGYCGLWRVTLDKAALHQGQLEIRVSITNSSRRAARLPSTSFAATPSAGPSSVAPVSLFFAAQQTHSLSETLPVPLDVRRVTLLFETVNQGRPAFLAWPLHG